MNNICNICYLNNPNNILIKSNYNVMSCNFMGKPRNDYKCNTCGSRLRRRHLKTILDKIKLQKGNTMCISSDGQERKLISEYTDIKLHVSLHGNHGDKNCIVGVDITKPLNRVIPKKTKFTSIFMFGVLDFIYNIESVFKNLIPYMDDNCTIFVWINPNRQEYIKKHI